LKRVEIGKITRPHGLRGEVRIQLHFAGSETLDQVESVCLSRDGTDLGERRIVALRPADKALLARFEGVDDRDAAERLRGVSVSVPRDALPPLEEGEYYLCDLIGAKVVGPDGDIGKVVDIRVHPSVDSLVILHRDGRTLEQALVPPWVESVDAERGVVELSSTDGLI
jgi:16S rRNA processing protein RimM